MKTDEIFTQLKKFEEFVTINSKNSKSTSDLVIEFFNEIIKESDILSSIIKEADVNFISVCKQIGD